MDSKLTMLADSSYIPKANPLKPRGEDAHFICNEAQVIGVADGVGGWSYQGIDAGEYARQLMEYAEYSVKNSKSAAVDPKSILTKAFNETMLPGSSTACIISLDGNRLRAANVGDSGFVVIRKGITIFQSPVQQREFNHPYQLGLTSDWPEEAEEMAVDLQSGDVVVAGTDGLFDNIFLTKVEETVAQCLEEKMTPAMTAGILAEMLAAMARQNSLKKKGATPFSVAAQEAGFEYSGGKYDDITVVAALISHVGTTLD